MSVVLLKATRPIEGTDGIGSKLREVRKQKRLSLQDVEALSNHEFKASVLGAYERNQRRIAVPRLQRLAQIYRVPVEQFLAGDSSDLAGAESYGRETRAAFDLEKLARVHGPERELLRRYLQSVEMQRQDYNGRVLTIRHDDMRVIASLFRRTPTAMVTHLRELGILIAR